MELPAAGSVGCFTLQIPGQLDQVMTLVVADSSPIRYLRIIEAIEVLPELYGGITIPKAVFEEPTHSHAPSEVRQWAEALPPRVGVRTPSATDLEGVLDGGEAEAIALAEELGADLVLIDEREGRREASRRGLRVMGTIGVLEQAAERGMLSLKASFKRLESTSFRIDRAYLSDALARDASRGERDRWISR